MGGDVKAYALRYKVGDKRREIKDGRGGIVTYSATNPAVYWKEKDAEFDAEHHMLGEAEVVEIEISVCP